MPEDPFDARELDWLFRGLTALENDLSAESFLERLFSPCPPQTKKDAHEKTTDLKFIAVLKAKLVKMEDSLIANIDELPQ